MNLNPNKTFESQAPRTLKQCIEECRGTGPTVENAKKFSAEEAEVMLPLINIALEALNKELLPLETKVRALQDQRFYLNKTKWAMEVALTKVTYHRKNSTPKQTFMDQFKNLSLEQMNEKIAHMERLLEQKKKGEL